MSALELRQAWVDVDAAAVTANAATLAQLVAPAHLCAVVKADGYGHGAVPVARAALAGGATWLAVALVEEGVVLREAGIDAPVLVLSEPPPGAWPEVVRHGLTATVYSQPGVEAAAKAVAELDASGPLPVHLKVDTGMHRVGASPAEVVQVALAVVQRPELTVEATWTHFAVADEPANPFTDEQSARFRAALADLRAAGVVPGLLHACNSAAAITRPDDRLDLVRCGIALYGIDPSPELAGVVELRPALSLRARVSFVRRVAGGEAVSYGQRYRLERESTVATVPLGYADGVPRRLGELGGEVLIRGRRRPLAGTITMDQLLVDCGDDRSVVSGDEVVLLGGQDDERVEASDWAARLGTIAYEVVCGIGARVPRHWT